MSIANFIIAKTFGACFKKKEQKKEEVITCKQID